MPNLNDLVDKASSDAKGFVSDVQDYVDSGAITTKEDADNVVIALKEIYKPESTADKSDKLEAASLAGEIIIDTNDNASKVVGNITDVLSTAINSKTLDNTDPADFIDAIFNGNPDDSSDDVTINNVDDLTKILNVFDQAALAYEEASKYVGFSTLDSDKKGDLVVYASISLVVASVRNEVGDQALYNAIKGGSITITHDPFDPGSGAEYASALDSIFSLINL